MGTDRLIYIRTDGNTTLAAGHLVRCLSIAQSCLQNKMQVCFLLSGQESKNLLLNFLPDACKENPLFHIHVLVTAAYDNIEQELSEVISLLLDTPGAVYLLDSYYVTEKYLTILNRYAKIAYLDDLMLFDYPVDLVINYDIPHAKAYQRAGKTLLGTAYAPLRPGFQNNAVAIKETVTDLLVTTGGSDPYHFCVEFLKAYVENISAPARALQTTADAAALHAPAFHSSTLHIVIGKLNTDTEILHTLAGQYPFIRLHENVTDMAAWMKQCDLAISAAGTTLYELCALGVPAISFTMADNQLTAAKAFDKAAAIPCAGDIREDMSAVIERIFDFLSQMKEVSKRKKAHQTMRDLVDGNGAARIAKALLEL